MFFNNLPNIKDYLREQRRQGKLGREPQKEAEQPSIGTGLFHRDGNRAPGKERAVKNEAQRVESRIDWECTSE